MYYTYENPGALLIASEDQSNNFVTIKPGTNHLDIDSWEKITTHPDVSDLIDDGKLSVASLKDGLLSDAIDIAKEDDRDAIKLIENTNDKTVIQAWSIQERNRQSPRRRVEEALNNQLMRL